MKGKTAIALLASVLTMAGCATSEPTTYGVRDRAWQAMSPNERRIAKKEYEVKNREPQNIIIAQNTHQQKIEPLAPRSSYYNEDEKKEDESKKEDNENEAEVSAMGPQQNHQKIEPYIGDDTAKQSLVIAENKPSSDVQEFPSISSSLYSDISKEDLARGSELIVFLQSQLGRPPLLGEMQKILQFNMNVTPRQARRMIDALGLY